MRGIFTTLAVCSFAAVSFAATLMPASGVYYPGDINNSGVIHVEFNDSVAAPTATINVNGSSVSANMFEEGSTGRFWAVQVQEALQDVVTTNGKAISLTVKGGSETATGSYTYMPVFPLTSIAPENYTEVSDKNMSVVFTFNQEVTYSSIVLTSGEKSTTLAGGNGTTVTVPVTAANWSDNSGQDNGITVQLVGAKVGSTYINNMIGGEGLIGATYVYKETVSLPTFIGVDQDPWWWLAQDLFGMEVEFDFNAPVNKDKAEATITFYRDSLKLTSVKVTSSEMLSGQNWRTGNYYLAIPIPDMSDVLLNDDDEWIFTTMEVTLTGVTAIGLEDPYTVTYDAEFPEDDAMYAPKKSGEAKINNIGMSQDQVVTVYNVDGSLVKARLNVNSINSLGRGLYIVNGKKILVK